MATVACAWCGKELRTGIPGTFLSHGMCVPCSGRNGFFPVEEIPPYSGGAVDHLPAGTVEVDTVGMVIGADLADEDAPGEDWSWVLGKHFFREVAPWTLVRQFEGQFARLIASGVSGEAELAFLARTARHERLVFLELVYEQATGRIRITIEQLA
jgi:photoactive yellow protein